ncbi:MAG: thrombospondin type 3 repeat-containing protein [Myxococcota bacterium]|nr:thrombospondin type 3 repeat-containing protein [Myxococcota bacterium]
MFNLLCKYMVTLSFVLLTAGCSLDFEEFSAPSEPDLGMADIPDGTVLDSGADQGSMVMPDMTLDLGLDDADGDGVPDGDDNCPNEANPDQLDLDEDGLGDACDDDADGDDVVDDNDNCPMVANPDQLDLNGDSEGDACDGDIDGDDVSNEDEETNGTDPYNPDSDYDGVADGPSGDPDSVADLCPLAIDPLNLDRDNDGIGDVCDDDDDGDGIKDWWDDCHLGDNVAGDDPAVGAARCQEDYDHDGVLDVDDPCPYRPGLPQTPEGQPCETNVDSFTYARETRDLFVLRVNGQVNLSRLLAATAGGLVVGSQPPSVIGLNTGLDDYSVRTLHASQDDWFLLTDSGLSIYDPNTARVFNVHRRELPSGIDSQLTAVAGGPDTIWVASDRGLNVLKDGAWTLLGEETLPATEVTDLHWDALDRVWAITPAGLVRFVGGEIDFTLDALPMEVGALVSVSESPDAEMWVFGEQAAFIIGADDTITNVLPDVVGTGAAHNGSETYVAHESGLIRVDESMRSYPVSRAPIPESQVTSVAPDPGLNITADRFWAGTSKGIFNFGGAFATYGANQTPSCVRFTDRIRGVEGLWIGTDSGLLRQSTSGSIEALDGSLLPGYDPNTGTSPRVNFAVRVDGQIWVGTSHGVGRYELNGEPAGALQGVFDEPVDVLSFEQYGQDIWLGTANHGLRRRNDAGQWEPPYTTASTSDFLVSNQITGLAIRGDILWISTPSGISKFALISSEFLDPVTLRGGRLLTNNITGVSANDGFLFFESSEGVSVQSGLDDWTHLRRDNNSIPDEAGTNTVLATTFDGEYLWVLLGNSARQPNGSLLRRSPDPNVNAPETMTLFPLGEIGLPAVGDATTATMSAKTTDGGEIRIGFCGDDNTPGGASILGARELLLGSLADRFNQQTRYALKGRGVDSALVTGPTGLPMLVGREDQQAIATELVPFDEQAPANPWPTEISLPNSFNQPPTDCDLTPDGERLWCLFGTEGFARRENDGQAAVQWQPTDADTIGLLSNAELRKIAVLGPSSWWMATNKGIFRYQGGGFLDYNVVRTGGELPSDDVRTIFVHDDKVYAGTALGVGILDLGENSWTTLGRAELGRHSSVRSLALADDQTLWIGSDQGLVKYPLADGEQELQIFTTEDNLPALRINDIVISESGRVIVATPGGLAHRAGMGRFERVGFAQGLPGRAAKQLFMDATRYVWVLSDFGVGRLNLE